MISGQRRRGFQMYGKTGLRLGLSSIADCARAVKPAPAHACPRRRASRSQSWCQTGHPEPDDFGSDGYGGARQPATSRITNRLRCLRSLPTNLDAKNDQASAALVGVDRHFHTLAKASLTGTYGRW